MKLSSAFLILIVVFIVSCNSGVKETSTETNLNNVISPVDSFGDYEKMLVHDSLNIELRSILANSYYSIKEYSKAIEHFLKIHELDNKNLDALISLGNVYYDSQQYLKAIDFYEKSLKIDSKNINVRCDLATCYLNAKLPETALKILKENIRMDYNHIQSHHNLAVVYGELGKTKEADEEMKIFNSLAGKK